MNRICAAGLERPAHPNGSFEPVGAPAEPENDQPLTAREFPGRRILYFSLNSTRVLSSDSKFSQMTVRLPSSFLTLPS